jgi:L-fucose isomerase-like protein
MKRARIVDVTPREPSALTTQIREAYGAEVVIVGGDELNSLYDKASVGEAKEWAQTWTTGAANVVEPTPDEIVQGGRMYLAMRNLLAAQRSRAITVDCLSLFYADKLRAYPCLGFFQLNNDNQVGACEADLTSTSTMLLMSYLIGQPGYISDPVIDTSRNRIIYAHCVAPSKVWGPDKSSNEYHIRSHSEDRKGAAVRSLMPLGVTTTTLEFLPGRREVLMHQARTVENIDDDRACRTKLAAEPRDAFKLAEDWDAGWHRVTYYGDHRAAVDSLAALLQFKVKVEG